MRLGQKKSEQTTDDAIMKALRKVNSRIHDDNSFTPEEIKKHRAAVDAASKLATPPIGISVDAFSIAAIACERVKPAFAHRTDRIILYAHGGGYITGRLPAARILAAKMALHTGLEVITFEYRLSPENKYPAAFEDALQVWDYLMYQGYGADDIILAGDSAGGNLALKLTQHLNTVKRMTPIALILFSPWTDMTTVSETYTTKAEEDPVLSKYYIESVRDLYIGEDVDASLPEYSPIYGDFSLFPKTLIQVGEHEVLLDDSRRLADAIAESGGYAKLQVYEDGWHVFQQMPTTTAGKAMDAVGEFVGSL